MYLYKWSFTQWNIIMLYDLSTILRTLPLIINTDRILQHKQSSYSVRICLRRFSQSKLYTKKKTSLIRKNIFITIHLPFAIFYANGQWYTNIYSTHLHVLSDTTKAFFSGFQEFKKWWKETKNSPVTAPPTCFTTASSEVSGTSGDGVPSFVHPSGMTELGLHDFCINLSFSRYISYICKEALHGLPLFDFVYSFPALFKKVLLWHYWSIHKESLPLHLLKMR